MRYGYELAIALFLATALGGGTTPAFAHVPEVGEAGEVSSVCLKRAQALLMDAARAESSVAATELFGDMVLTGVGCASFEPPVFAHVLAVGEMILTSDGVEMYSLKIELEDWRPIRKWYSTHFHEGERV